MTEEEWDEKLVYDTAAKMREQLRQAREKGKHSWHDFNRCSVSYLVTLLHVSLSHEDWIDVINYAAMIMHRESDEHQCLQADEGDKGQRYEVTFYDPSTLNRKVLGWTPDLDNASRLVKAINLHPTRCLPLVYDNVEGRSL